MLDLERYLIWGGQSQARLISAMLAEQGYRAPIIFDDTLPRLEFDTDGVFINDVLELHRSLSSLTKFAVCIGAEHGYARVKTGRTLSGLGLEAPSVIHSNSFIDPTSVVGHGCQIMPGSIIHKFSTIGNYAIINTGATVDHECDLGDGVHIMGNAAIAGSVKVGDFATIGTNATILPYITIGRGAYVGAGAVVTKNVAENEVVAGVPARFVRTNNHQFRPDALDRLRELRSKNDSR